MGTSAGAAKRARCTCGAFVHAGPCKKPGPQPRPLMDRLWEKVDRRGPDECWPWTAGRQPGGYGTIDKQNVSRILLGLEVGDPREARHTCDNPPCCNPAHLIAGTSQENADDMVERGRSMRGERHWNWQGGGTR